MARVPEVALIALSVATRPFALEFVSRKIEETRGQVAPKVGTATWNDTANGLAENLLLPVLNQDAHLPCM